MGGSGGGSIHHVPGLDRLSEGLFMTRRFIWLHDNGKMLALAHSELAAVANRTVGFWVSWVGHDCLDQLKSSGLFAGFIDSMVTYIMFCRISLFLFGTKITQIRRIIVFSIYAWQGLPPINAAVLRN